MIPNQLSTLEVGSLEERVCRAMCEADGLDPDGLTYPFVSPEAERDFGLGDVIVTPDGSPPTLRPRWQNYQRLARYTLAAWRELFPRS